MAEIKKFTIIHRLLHWLIAIAMFVLFITGFLRMYWMNKKGMVAIIESKTTSTPVAEEVLSDIASTIRQPMWEWHEIFANVMIVAFVARILYMLFKGIRFPNPFSRKIQFKERLQGFVYVYFYVFVFISAFTGICIENKFFDAYHETIETVHKWGIYWFPIFIILHLAGIVLAEHTTKKGITSKMIGGD
ncbi:cytochrome b/b6 domain-containing protein [Flavobacterium sp.]|uniref:cytochrome b/b6 domain-containing protein n=1 Tax=Flavobacterium sp. TaxID=239 RepID=UPI00263367CD|nr:cytochrome b/b6 domain-containing protein [Flavobacterium sp.]MDD3005022.1 cytochrome b/b6 domain-containing protein [Flavobacterium sp.]